MSQRQFRTCIHSVTGQRSAVAIEDVVVPVEVVVASYVRIIFVPASEVNTPFFPVSKIFEVYINDPSLVGVAWSINRSGEVCTPVRQFYKLSAIGVEVVVLWLANVVRQPYRPLSTNNIQMSSEVALRETIFSGVSFHKLFRSVSDIIRAVVDGNAIFQCRNRIVAVVGCISRSINKYRSSVVLYGYNLCQHIVVATVISSGPGTNQRVAVFTFTFFGFFVEYNFHIIVAVIRSRDSRCIRNLVAFYSHVVNFLVEPRAHFVYY